MTQHRTPSPYLSPLGRGGIHMGVGSAIVAPGPGGSFAFGTTRTPSPRRGEGWGEGAPALRNSLDVMPTVGAEQNFLADHFQDAIEIAGDICIPEADDAVAEALDCFRARGICGDAVVGAVLAAVKFDDEFQTARTKIGDVTSDHFLAHEFGVFDLAVAQALPEFAFNVGLVAAKASCSLDQSPSSHTSHSLTLPLPAGERGRLLRSKSCSNCTSHQELNHAQTD